MNEVQRTIKPDIAGAIVGVLCALHCIATPFLFIAKASASTGHVEVPGWYQVFDYLFIVISFIAVFYAAQNSSKEWAKRAFWVGWGVLLLAILNETFELRHLPEASVYIPALILAGLHLYNRKYCQCADEGCCASNQVK